MKRNKPIVCNDYKYFYEECKDIKRIKQDTVFHNQSYKLYKKRYEKRNICKQEVQSQFFNYISSGKNIMKNPVSYVREKCLMNELKKLKNNIYIPDVWLDVHGLNLNQVKKEIGKCLVFCSEKKIFCFAIIHGHGKNILKNQIPIWLSNHPDVIAFYQSPKMFGKNTTLFVLMDFRTMNRYNN
ncbi:endonuclease SmrB [Buchnera aphidicola]|uniref:endonuclease SmrB n=1 Tax=Buchnera aphidicola TaxID=9 RepID=UPI0034642871